MNGGLDKFPKSLMEEMIAAMQTLAREAPENPELRYALEEYVYGAVVPFLLLLWNQHFPMHISDSGVPELQMLAYKACQEAAIALYGSPGQTHNNLRIEQMMESIGLGGTVKIMRLERAHATGTTVNTATHFKRGFPIFVLRLGLDELEIKDPLNRSIGDGVRDLALLLAGNDNISITYENGEKTSVNPREVIYNMYNTLTSDQLLYSNSAGPDAELARNLLKVSRSIVYMDDPHMSREKGFFLDPHSSDYAQVTKLWQSYCEDTRITKLEPSAESLLWVQNKYVKLGAAKVVIGMLCHPSSKVKVTCLRFAMAAMEGRCKPMQDAMLAEIKRTRNHSMFRSLYNSLNQCRVSLEKYSSAASKGDVTY